MKFVPWSDAETATLCEVYPSGGLRAARLALPGRTDSAISQRASTLGLNVRTPRGTWDEADVAILRSSYASGGRAAAVVALPHRTTEAISAKASALGIAVRRGRPPKAKPVAKPEPPVVPVVRRTVAPAPPRIVVRDGTCDHGDREHIRKRLEFVFADLSRELGRGTYAIRRVVVDWALDGFVERRLSAIDRENVS